MADTARQDTTQVRDWMFALAQHPMYLIIKEDSQCAERTPPWGEPTIERYIARLRDNLAALQRYPRLKIGYEWSGVEVELLAQDAPEVLRQMCALAREGRTTFYNGTYAQPHLQILSAEANFRQFEHGMHVYRDLCGHQVLTYAHQEASVHDQVPQLLAAFGIAYAVVPGFSSTLVFLEAGEVVLFSPGGPRFVQGHDFVAWRGLDGTEIPLYLRPTQDGARLDDFLARQAIAGRLHAPPIIVEDPDLEAIDEAWLEKHQNVEPVLLDEALKERLQQSPPRARARLFTNWSYIEGIRAEELSRATHRAERAALQAEGYDALAFILLQRPAQSTDRLWKTILRSQHHDAFCFCAPELKGKAIGWLQGAAHEADRLADEAAQAIATQVTTAGQDGQPLIVLQAVPHASTEVVTLEVPVEDPLLVDRQGNVLASEVVPTENGNTQMRFLTDAAGLGYTTCWIRAGGTRAIEESHDGSVVVDNAFYRTILEPDGTFSSLVVQPSGDELLDAGSVRGNQLAAMDSTGLSPRREGQMPREDWQPPRLGPALHWEPADVPHVRRSPLGTTVIIRGRMGPRVSARLTVAFYARLPRIDLRWDFSFDAATIGTFYDDDSKLRVQWPLAFSGAIAHDIPFGVVQSPDERPFFPTTWVDISDGTKGLAYLHQGTPKHWVSGRTLTNLFAWGEDTEAIGSRLWRYNWPKAFDQRLQGDHTIQCAVYPHRGDWRTASVPAVARSYGSPPVAYLTDQHTGTLPTSTTVLTLTNPEIAATAVKVEEAQVICRLYSLGRAASAVHATMEGAQRHALRSLAGEPLDQLRPFQIGTLILEPQQQKTTNGGER